MDCKKCAKELTCKQKDCKPVNFSKTKNYGIVNYINRRKEKRKAIKEKQDYYKRYF